MERSAWERGPLEDRQLCAGLLGGSLLKNLPARVGGARAPGSIPGSGRSPEVGNENPLQYSCLENSMDRGARRATVYGVAKKSQTQLTAKQQRHALALGFVQ